jgi:endonuclease YncB( thermonuclease family)
MRFLLLLLMCLGPAAAADTLTGQATVIDGDTIEIHGQRIRLEGIDAPESRQSCTNAAGTEYHCGQAAAFALADRIGRAVVKCEGDERDRYKRRLAVCSADGIDLSAWLVEQGLAVAYRKYSTAYVPQEDKARTAMRGIWAGAFEMPWDWRKKR